MSAEALSNVTASLNEAAAASNIGQSFEQALDKAMASFSSSIEPGAANGDALFAAADSNGGGLDASEFADATGLTEDPGLASDLFSAVDTNKDNSIDQAEWKALTSVIDLLKPSAPASGTEGQSSEVAAEGSATNEAAAGESTAGEGASGEQEAAPDSGKEETSAAGKGTEDKAASGSSTGASNSEKPAEGTGADQGGGASDSLYKLLLAMFDENGDGKLDLSELSGKAKEMLSKFDANGDGTLSKAEMAAAVESLDSAGVKVSDLESSSSMEDKVA